MSYPSPKAFRARAEIRIKQFDSSGVTFGTGAAYSKSADMMWPLALYFIFVLVLVAAVIVVSYLLGQRHSERATGEPYEGGIAGEGSARARFSVGYSQIAMFFVVFDLEAVFLFAWACAAREVGWAGYTAAAVFIATLAAALFYLWRAGALDWASKPLISK